MLRNIILLFVVISCVLSNSYTSFAPFLKACKLNEDDCLLAANLQIALPYLADGVNEIEVPATDPVIFENLTMGSGGEKFKFTLPTLKIDGGRKCKVVDFVQNLAESSMKMTIDCPMLGTGTYKFSGKMGIFMIDKEGDFKLQTDGMRTELNIKVEKIVMDGKKYWKLLSYEYTCEPAESMHIELDGLFSGDLARARPFLSAANKDMESMIEIGEPISRGLVKNFFESLKKLFMKVPINDILHS